VQVDPHHSIGVQEPHLPLRTVIVEHHRHLVEENGLETASKGYGIRVIEPLLGLQGIDVPAPDPTSGDYELNLSLATSTDFVDYLLPLILREGVIFRRD